MPDPSLCPKCQLPFDLQDRQAKWLPCGHSYCKACLLDVANAPAEVESPEPPELPEELLLHIFSLLSTEVVLRGPRGVCRRWRDATRHPSLWRRRDLSSFQCPWLPVALRLAPCARTLTLGELEAVPGAWELAAASDCVVRDLSLQFLFTSTNRPATAAPARCILQRQVQMKERRDPSRPGLQNLSLSGLPREGAAEVVALVLGAGLASLEIDLEGDNSDPELPRLCLDGKDEVRPSLRQLKYRSCTADGLLESLLEAHASTLESVSLQYGVASGRAIQLLADCPQLREAHLPGMAEISHLCGCLQLRSLTLEEWETSALPLPFFQGVAARQLTRLSFDWCDEHVDSSVMEVLRALAASGQSALRELYIADVQSEGVLGALPAVLRGLPHLHTLELRDSPPEAVLDVIDSRLAPSLRLLSFRNLYRGVDICDETCCFPRLFALVQRMPRLHVSGLLRYHDCTVDGVQMLSCDCCTRRLHSLRAVTNDVHCGLFGHAPSVECGLDAHRDTMDSWIWVGAAPDEDPQM